MRYTIQMGIMQTIVENSTTAVEDARFIARTLSFEAYQHGRQIQLARNAYPLCRS